MQRSTSSHDVRSAMRTPTQTPYKERRKKSKENSGSFAKRSAHHNIAQKKKGDENENVSMKSRPVEFVPRRQQVTKPRRRVRREKECKSFGC